MCNAFNHSRGCRCGFGGEGHRGRGGGPAKGHRQNGAHSNALPRHWTGRSMSQRAVELRRSLLFPVRCRFCGVQIFLFADPDGGFAIFSQIGKPWPKHRCSEMCQDPSSSYDSSTLCSDEFDLPVPWGTPFAEYEAGRVLQGTVVKVMPECHPRTKNLFGVVLFNGRVLFRIRSRKSLPIGVVVTGIARFVPDIGCCLVDVKRVDPGFRKRTRRKPRVSPRSSGKRRPRLRTRKG